MNSPLAVLSVSPLPSPSSSRRLARHAVSAACASLAVALLCLPATRLHAQSEGWDRFPLMEGTPIDGPEIDHPEAHKPPAIAIQSTSFDLPGEHTTGAGTVYVRSENGYAGTVNLTCGLETKTSTPTPPECAMYPATVTLVNGGRATPQILIFGKGTTLPTGVTIGSNARRLGGAGVALACCLLLGVPARRRAWKSALLLLVLLVGAGGVTACVATPKIITHGYYIFKVEGKDPANPDISTAGTVAVSVL